MTIPNRGRNKKRRDGLYESESSTDTKKFRFIGGAERARREAQRPGWEPPSRRRKREQREREKKDLSFMGERVLSASKLRSSERFFAALLESFGNQLRYKSNHQRKNDRALLEEICWKLGLGIPPFGRTSQRHDHGTRARTISHTEEPKAFFATRAILVMEESRHELAESLKKSSVSRTSKNNRSEDSAKGYNSSWRNVELVEVQEQNRTGFLLLDLEKPSGRFSPEELHQQRPGSCFEVVLTMNRSKGSGTVSTDDNSSRKEMELRTIGSVGPCKRGSTKLVLVIYDEWSIASIRNAGMVDPDCSFGTMKVKIRFCTTLISQCRQFEACDFANVRHFHRGNHRSKGLLKKIMGQKQATHIRFEYSDDDNESDQPAPTTTQEGAEEIIGYIIDKDAEPTEYLYGSDDDLHPATFDPEVISANEPQAKGPRSRLHLSLTSFTGLKALNPTQQIAASDFCNRDKSQQVLKLVQGPPGTGKTTFVVSVLARLLCSDSKQRTRILVTAPTNKAISVIARRFLEACPGLLEDHGIPVALIGVEDKLLETKKSEKGSRTVLESAAASSFGDSQLRRIFCYTWIASLAEDYQNLLMQLESVTGNLGQTHSVALENDRGVSAWLPKAFPQKYTSSYDLMVNSDTDSDTEDDERESTASASVGPTSKESVELLTTRARGLHVRLVRNLPVLSESSGLAKLSRKAIECLKEGPQQNLTEAGFFLRELLKILNGEQNPTAGQSSIDSDDSEGNLDSDAVPELLATARIIFCTLSTAGTSLMKQTRRVDDWIVDEAAAATEAELLIPLHLHPQRLLAVGDPMQLPASVASPWAEEWGLASSLHERLTTDLGHPQTMLDVQYRMKPEISEFPSNEFYGGKLTNGETVEKADYGSAYASIHKGGPMSKAPWCFFQIDGTEKQSSSGSYFNVEEASAVVAFVKSIRKNAVSQGPKCNVWSSPEKVRIITFYSAQVATIQQMLRREGMSQVLVATVDSSQGCEADIVILSFVRSTRAGFLADDRRLNVAMTRAKYKLICLGNIQDSIWANDGNHGKATTLTRMVESAKQNNDSAICFDLSSREGSV